MAADFGSSSLSSSFHYIDDVPLLIRRLSSPNSAVRDQAICALRFISGVNPVYCMQCEIVVPLRGYIKLETCSYNVKNLHNATLTVANLFRSKHPPPSTEAVNLLVPEMKPLLRNPDKEVVRDACWALNYVTNSSPIGIQAVIDAGITPRLVELMGSEDTTCVYLSLCVVGNMVTGTDEQTQRVLNFPVLVHFKQLLTHPRADIVEETSWAISNITAGPQLQIQSIIDNCLAQLLINILMIKGEFNKAKKEAVCAVANITACGTVYQIMQILDMGALRVLCDHTVGTDCQTVSVALGAIGNILNVAKETNQLEQVCRMVEECGGLDKIERLQRHDDNSVYQKSFFLIKEYFSGDEEEDSSITSEEEDSSIMSEEEDSSIVSEEEDSSIMSEEEEDSSFILEEEPLTSEEEPLTSEEEPLTSEEEPLISEEETLTPEEEDFFISSEEEEPSLAAPPK